MKQSQFDEFLQEVKELLDYAIESRCWTSIEEVREMIYDELGEEIFVENKEDEDE